MFGCESHVFPMFFSCFSHDFQLSSCVFCPSFCGVHTTDLWRLGGSSHGWFGATHRNMFHYTMIIDTDQISKIIHIVTISCIYIYIILYYCYYYYHYYYILLLLCLNTISNYYSYQIVKSVSSSPTLRDFSGALGTLGTWREATWEGQASRARRF